VAPKTVLARKNEDGHLELLEPVELPEGRTFRVTLELVKPVPARRRIRFLVRSGKPLGKLTRDEIYEDVG
jgi:predicted DNA-binding antitoxin AbrB/MazE fold protein